MSKITVVAIPREMPFQEVTNIVQTVAGAKYKVVKADEAEMEIQYQTDDIAGPTEELVAEVRQALHAAYKARNGTDPRFGALLVTNNEAEPAKPGWDAYGNEVEPAKPVREACGNEAEPAMGGRFETVVTLDDFSHKG